MAGTSLSANHIAPAGGGYEPQRSYNWFLYLNGVAGQEQIRLAMVSAFLPTESNEIIEIRFGNETRYVAGAIKFDAGQITVRDYIDKDTYGLLRAWRDSVADLNLGNVNFASSYKKTARIVLTAPDSSTTREYQLTGLWPTKITPGHLTYEGPSAQLEVQMDLRYDKALHA